MSVGLPQEQNQARHFLITGQVQGVGFRPFVYRLAHELKIQGWVRNVSGSVAIHAEGGAQDLERFAELLISKAPAIARPRLKQTKPVPDEHHTDFYILPSREGEANIHVPPDFFACDDCLREMNDPANRRHRYPFTNCTQCGPRYTLIESLPYDRPHTTMKSFLLCPDCEQEYMHPLDRRFHAEPVACPKCGPQLVFVEPGEAEIEGNEAALVAAIAFLKEGYTVAVKGIGGYHLMCDARNDEAIARLRTRKPRPYKPFAVMFPADGAALAKTVEFDEQSLNLLQSPHRPILLLPRKHPEYLSANIAPGLNEIGCMLPYSPLHTLLLEGFGGPLVATSGNVSGEPVITENEEAQTRLTQVVDAFLHHNRPIARPADDSVYRIIAAKPRPLRIGRGLAPLELELPTELPEPVLALGAHTKNAIALAWENRVVISPHIGDLSSVKSLETLARVAKDLQSLYQVKAVRLLLDRHPNYGYRHFARDSGLPVFEVLHHHAHASALTWEFAEAENCIVFAWDGVGLGENNELWGGEAFTGSPGHWQHVGTFRPFRLPGGEHAGREPWRSAAALLWETNQAADFAPELLYAAWQKGINAPPTRAVGRLFDAAAALTVICTHASFEGEGPMKLEAAAAQHHEILDPISLTLVQNEAGLWQNDWSPLLPMLRDQTLTSTERAACFHASLAQALLDQALHLCEQQNIADVGLTGGVFQNRLLTETAKALLEQHGFRVHLPQRVPVNDAGVCLGQVMEFLFSDKNQ
jgi:hydrogenase maturation protein HypF